MTAETVADNRILERSEIAVEHTWDLEAIYATPEDWEADFGKLDDLVEPIVALRGKLDSAAALARLGPELSAWSDWIEHDGTGFPADLEGKWIRAVSLCCTGGTR